MASMHSPDRDGAAAGPGTENQPPPACRFRAGKAAAILTAIMVALLALHVAAMQAVFNESLGLESHLGPEYWHLSVFDLDEEESFDTWFVAIIMALAAALLFHRARVARAAANAWYRWWTVLGAGFCVMSIDEVVALHELFNTLDESTPWTIAGFVVAVVVGLAYLPPLWRYRWRTSLLLVLSGAIYVGGAVVVEHFSGTDVNSLAYNMSTALEEGMEMLGVIMLIHALLDSLQASWGGELRVDLAVDKG